MSTCLERPAPKRLGELCLGTNWIVLKALIAVLVRREIITDDDLQKVLAHARRDLAAQESDTLDPKTLAAAKKLIDTFRHQ